MADPERPRTDRGAADLERLDREKRLAAQAALRWVRTGMTMGLGSGSTAAYFIQFLGERVRAGSLALEAVCSSTRSEALARAASIPITAPRRGLRLDLTVDGADEISPELNLIKGRGGALLREKVLAEASRYFLVIADSSKRVPRLGRLPVPVEVLPFAAPWVQDRIAALGGQPDLRPQSASSGEPYRTDQNNFVLDCVFDPLNDPATLGEQLDKIPGVVGHGLFLGCAQAALLAVENTVSVLQPGREPVPLDNFPLPS